MLAASSFGACNKGPSAADVCKKIEAAGVGKNCKEGERKMLSGRASSKYDFDLVAVPGKTGQVLSFDRDDDYQATEKAFREAGMLAGPHRYGSAKARIFVQMNEGLSTADGNKVKALVDAL